MKRRFRRSLAAGGLFAFGFVAGARADVLLDDTWVDDPAQIQVVGDQNTATEAADRAARFFRLIRP